MELATLEGLERLDQTQLHHYLATYQVLRQLAREEALDGLAVRCWPEFFNNLRCSACGPLALLTDEQIPCSCEADINGTITQLILQWLAEQPAFGSDLVSLDVEADTLVLWHCGLAPLSMAAFGHLIRMSLAMIVYLAWSALGRQIRPTIHQFNAAPRALGYVFVAAVVGPLAGM